jgi:hypothetical protein
MGEDMSDDKLQQSRAPVGEDVEAPSNERLQELVKPIWRKAKPSRLAQSIRSSLSVEFDDPQYASWVSDFMPDYVWDLVDIAAQRGIDTAIAAMPPPAEREALRIAREIIGALDRRVASTGSSLGRVYLQSAIDQLRTAIGSTADRTGGC